MTAQMDLYEETLDPKDLDGLRALGHRMLDHMFDRVAGVRERTAWRPVPESAKEEMRAAVPMEGVTAGVGFYACLGGYEAYRLVDDSHSLRCLVGLRRDS